MRRNWEIIRELLTKVEECTLPTDIVRLCDFPQERHAEISYHMALLIEAGLISAGSIPRPLGRELVENQQIEERS